MANRHTRKRRRQRIVRNVRGSEAMLAAERGRASQISSVPMGIGKTGKRKGKGKVGRVPVTELEHLAGTHRGTDGKRTNHLPATECRVMRSRLSTGGRLTDSNKRGAFRRGGTVVASGYVEQFDDRRYFAYTRNNVAPIPARVKVSKAK